MSLDFSNAELPRLLPLEGSYTENDIEADLKRMFIDVFNAMLAEDVFDMNVLGAAHLGSFELVRRAVNADGLVLLPGDREEAATRYLYRAWKSGNVQGRGLHFLRTYLQMLFPNIGEAIQLWHGKELPYPSDLRETESDDAFLTSRIRISINGFPSADSDRRIMSCVTQVIPARFIPKLRYVASSIGKMRAAVIGSITQNFSTSGELGHVFAINGQTLSFAASAVNGAQILNTNGVAS